MKKTMYLIPVLALFIMLSSAFISEKKASIPDVMADEYLHSVIDAQLIDRFETQFYDIFNEVSHVDAHQNKTSGDYYYTVYGSDAANNLVVDFFKTTKEEVLTSTYNFIEMNARTLGGNKCRATHVFPPPSGYYCSIYNQGYICGIQIGSGCLSY